LTSLRIVGAEGDEVVGVRCRTVTENVVHDRCNFMRYSEFNWLSVKLLYSGSDVGFLTEAENERINVRLIVGMSECKPTYVYQYNAVNVTKYLGLIGVFI